MFYFSNLYVLNNLLRGKKETEMSEEGRRGSEKEGRKRGREGGREEKGKKI